MHDQAHISVTPGTPLPAAHGRPRVRSGKYICIDIQVTAHQILYNIDIFCISIVKAFLT